MIITKLAEIFQNYKTCPQKCFIDGSPVREFIKKYSTDSYAMDIQTFISYQDYKPTQRGADLPWWGKKYFTGEDGFHVFIVAQDSNTPDAGSIVFFSSLFPHVETREQYKQYTALLKPTCLSKKPFSFGSYIGIRNKLDDWGINKDFIYITDAAKVYTYGSKKDNDFDWEKSSQLLQEEINICNPNLIVLLGWKALRILDNKLNFKDCADKHSFVQIVGKQVVVAPFLCGQGLGHSNFKKRYENAKYLINKAMLGK
jgi:hypothetical protein